MTTNNSFFKNTNLAKYDINVKQLKFLSTTTPNILFVNSTGETVSRNIDTSDFDSNTFSLNKFNVTNLLGYTGPQGSQGSIGAIGYQGNNINIPVGQTGSIGQQGSIGYQGKTGSTGIRGVTGAQGFIGEQGSIGRQGITGVTGATGLPGLNSGITGPNGFDGTDGQGARGFTGSFKTNSITSEIITPNNITSNNFKQSNAFFKFENDLYIGMTGATGNDSSLNKLNVYNSISELDMTSYVNISVTNTFSTFTRYNPYNLSTEQSNNWYYYHFIQDNSVPEESRTGSAANYTFTYTGPRTQIFYFAIGGGVAGTVNGASGTNPSYYAYGGSGGAGGNYCIGSIFIDTDEVITVTPGWGNKDRLDETYQIDSVIYFQNLNVTISTLLGNASGTGSNAELGLNPDNHISLQFSDGKINNKIKIGGGGGYGAINNVLGTAGGGGGGSGTTGNGGIGGNGFNGGNPSLVEGLIKPGDGGNGLSFLSGGVGGGGGGAGGAGTGGSEAPNLPQPAFGKGGDGAVLLYFCNPGSFYSNGSVTINGNCSAISFPGWSDYRIKDNITPITSSIDVLRPVLYRNKLTNFYDMGFIAHEVQKYFPHLVIGEKDDKQALQSINYNGIIALLTKEIQKTKNEINELYHTSMVQLEKIKEKRCLNNDNDNGNDNI
jgi:hypothetical protein